MSADKNYFFITTTKRVFPDGSGKILWSSIRKSSDKKFTISIPTEIMILEIIFQKVFKQMQAN